MEENVSCPFMLIYLFNQSKIELDVFVSFNKPILLYVLFSKISQKFNKGSKCITGIEYVQIALYLHVGEGRFAVCILYHFDIQNFAAV